MPGAFGKFGLSFEYGKEPKKIKSIETGISDLRNSLKGTDTEEVKKKTQTLIQASMKLGEAVYKSQQKNSEKKSSPIALMNLTFSNSLFKATA